MHLADRRIGVCRTSSDGARHRDRGGRESAPRAEGLGEAPAGRADRAREGRRRAAQRDEGRGGGRACPHDGPAGALWRRVRWRQRTHRIYGVDRGTVAGAAGGGGVRPVRAPDRARAARRRLRHRALELPLSDRDQHHRPGADRRQRGGDQACHADPSGRRADRPRLPRGGPAGERLRQCLPRPCRNREADRGRRVRLHQLHGIGQWRPRHRARRGGHLHRPGARARRQGSRLCHGGRRRRLGGRRAHGRCALQFGTVLLRHRAYLRRQATVR